MQMIRTKTRIEKYCVYLLYPAQSAYKAHFYRQQAEMGRLLGSIYRYKYMNEVSKYSEEVVGLRQLCVYQVGSVSSGS